MHVTPEEAKAAASLMKKGNEQERRQAAQVIARWQHQQGRYKWRSRNR